jgi:DNA-directed RNA polymerase specialized sigma24 family protein
MHSSDPAEGLEAALRRLVAIREDPRIKRFALRYAGHPDLADDALQSAFYAMVRLKNLGQIKNLRAYFCKVLVREVHRARGQLGATLVDDFARVAEARQDRVSRPSIEDEVYASLRARSWLNRLAAGREALMAAVPARSDDPDRYRAVIFYAAEQVLRDGINGESSEGGTNPAFRTAYPEYFGQPDASLNTCHQRFRRARMDLRGLLQVVVRQDELS